MQCVAIVADWIVESMDEISHAINKDWVALMLLPLITSIPGERHDSFVFAEVLTHNVSEECITAMRVSVKDELSLSIFVAIGSTIVSPQPLLSPLVRLTCFRFSKPRSLLFRTFLHSEGLLSWAKPILGSWFC